MVTSILADPTWAQGPRSIPEAAQTDRYSLHRFTSEDGLPQNTVHAIAQDNNGAIWVATLAGLARFDGGHFTTFDHGNTPAFTADAFNAIAVDAMDGCLWIGGVDGIYRYSQRRFEKVASVKNGVFRLWPAAQGGVWFDRGKGDLGRVRGVKVSSWRYAPESLLQWICLVDDKLPDVVRIAADDGIYLLDPATGVITAAPATWWAGVRTALLESTNLWAGTTNTLLHWENGNWPPSSPIGTNALLGRVDNLIRDSNGVVWCIVDSHKIGQLRDGSIHVLELPDLSPSEEIDCLCTDQEGAVWIGSKNGLMSVRPTRVKVLTANNGLLDNEAYGVCEDSNGTIFVATESGVAALHPGEARFQPVATLRSRKMVWTDSHGRLWISWGGWKLWEDGALHDVLFDTIRSNFIASSILEESSGALCFGCEGTLVKLGVGKPASFRFTGTGECDWAAKVLHQDREGVLWVGTYGGGLMRFANGRLDTFRANGGEYENRFWTLYEDARGVIWLGSQNGLHRFEHGRFFSFHAPQGLPEGVVNHVLEDDHGFLWISGLKGIYRISKSQLDDVAAGRRDRFDYLPLGEADGMLSPETNGENGNSACKTKDGRLWFPTELGVVVIEPGSFLADDPPPPPVRIEEIKVDNRIILGDGVPNAGLEELDDSGVPNTGVAELQLQPGQGSLVVVTFTANSFVAPAKILFKYRLLPQQTNWIDAGGSRCAIFPNLSPGHYHFEVTACNSHGIWQPVPTGFLFMIAPHFYQTWAFYLLCGATVVVAGGWFQAVRAGVGRRIAALEQEAAVERERSRIARDLHDELGSGLARVVLLSDAQTDQVRTEHRPQDVAREMMQKLDGIVWSLNPARADARGVSDYLAGLAEQFIAPTSMQLRLDLPQTQPVVTLTPSQRHHLLLAFKEMLRNSVMHSQARTVTVRISFSGAEIEVGVGDDGIGFDSAVRPPHRHGLSNLARRAADLGGRFELRSTPGQGTQVVIRFPCGTASAFGA